MKNILIVSPDYISVQMAGPGIRYWNFATTLSKTFNVTLLTPNHCELTSNFRILQLNKETLINELKSADSIVIQGMTLWQYPIIKKYKVPIVVDLYDPFVFENLETFNGNKDDNQMHVAGLSVLTDQLQYGDYFICASEKQKDFWLGMLTAINRVNPIEYKSNKTLSSLIGVVPFGLEPGVPVASNRVMKGVVPGITKDDHVVLWGGGIWPWLDPLTAVESMKILSEKHENIKLYFMGIKHPNPSVTSMNIVDEVIEMSDRLKLTNKYVFFNDWVNYDERYNYYLEADIGLSLHFNHVETRFSFRTRMLDYIRCELPIICTSGDVFSETVQKYEIGAVIPSEDAKILALKIEETLKLNKDIKNYEELHSDFTWDHCVKPLVVFCEKPYLSSGKKHVIRNRKFNRINYYFVKMKHYGLKGNWDYLYRKLISRK
ncbi:glycosyltransferase [Paenibacillus endoradicis]|uniref:glycosyltransferase n=1 Tax=Paenibacillus endoradicis TaxID=2972487 RepID=UPI002158AD42|nr:glycosyltransferase [Paenibacillus endoradicis]MCR8659823.1 glycosyltransferase [Paenibacillus endoradicis]